MKNPQVGLEDDSGPALGRRALLSVAAVSAVAGCADRFSLSDGDDHGVSISAPESVAIDEPFALSVDGLEGEAIELEAATEDADGTAWAGRARFEVADDRVDLDEAQPLEGTYDTDDPMGLFWSMEPAEWSPAYLDDHETQTVTIRVLSDAAEGDEPESLAETTIERRSLDPESDEEEFDEPFVGTVVDAPGGDPAPGVVLFHGSGAYRTVSLVRTIAGHGYTVLALQYFGTEWETLPDELVEVPIEYVDDAVAWFREYEAVSDASISLGGVSRGGELAMLMGTRLDDVGAVVNWVGSAITFNGLDSSFEPDSSAWSLDGEPLEHPEFEEFYAEEGSTGSLESDYEAVLEFTDDDVLESAEVPIEEIDAPILLISAGDDDVWPSQLLLNRAESRLEELGYDHPSEHLTEDDAGHAISYPYAPTWANHAGEMGGTPEASARLEADSWPSVLEYLERGASR